MAEYTPVRKEGRKIAQKLGDYMHKAKRHHDSDDTYWRSFRALLDTGITELEFSTTGNLLGPPLNNPKTGDGFMYLEDHEEDKFELLKGLKDVVFKVEYE